MNQHPCKGIGVDCYFCVKSIPIWILIIAQYTNRDKPFYKWHLWLSCIFCSNNAQLLLYGIFDHDGRQECHENRHFHAIYEHNTKYNYCSKQLFEGTIIGCHHICLLFSYLILFYKVLDLDQIRILTSIESEINLEGSKKNIKNAPYQRWLCCLRKIKNQLNRMGIDKSMNNFGSANFSWSKLRIFTLWLC